MALRHLFPVLIVCICGALAGCAIPKPEAADEQKKPTPAAESTAENPKPPIDDGFRTGDLLALPNESEYRATNPSPAAPNPGAGTVIVGPPKDD